MNIAPLISIDKLIDLLKDLWTDFKPIIFLNDYDKGVIMRRGRFHHVLTPGINGRIPFYDEYHVALWTTDTMATAPIHITTTDDKTISAVPVVEFTIEDEIKYLVYTNDARSNMHDITRSAVSDYLTDCTWVECKLKRTINAITRRVADECKKMGVNVSRVMLTDMCISRVIITKIDGQYVKEEGKPNSFGT